MSEAILIWLYLSLGNIFGGEVFGVVIVFLSVWLVFGSIFMLDKNMELDEVLGAHKKHIPIKSIILLAVLTSIYPTKDDLQYIIGGYLVINSAESVSNIHQSIAKIEGAEKLPENIINAMNNFLEGVSSDKE